MPLVPADSDVFSEPLHRMNVVGTSGSGKSTFAKKLGQTLQYPYVEMDKVFWKPNWQQPTDEEFFAKLRLALEGPRWVLDGNYTRTVPIKWERIDLVIWWTITTYEGTRKKYESYLTDPRFQHIRFVRLRSRKETVKFLDGIRGRLASG